MKAIFFILFPISLFANCKLPNKPKLSYTSKFFDTYLIKINLSQDNLLFSSENIIEPIKEFQKGISAHTNVDPISLIERQYQVYKEHNADESELKKFEAILYHKAGGIRKINCLEQLLLSTQLGLRNDFRTEFSAIIFKKGPFLSILFTSSKLLAVPMDKVTYKFIDKRIKKGWKLIAHLHNHPFVFDNSSNDIAGTLVPSGSAKNGGDIFAYLTLMKRYKLKVAMITNGFNTIDFRAADIIKLLGHQTQSN